MRRTIATLTLLLSVGANALTLSPMRVDDLVYSDLYMAHFDLRNTDEKFRAYDVWISTDTEKQTPKDGAFFQKEVLGGESYKKISVPIYGIEPNKLEVYYVCVQERPVDDGIGIVGRICAKLRLYWPRRELQTLQ